MVPSSYNITAGGGGTLGYHLSNETREKISKAHRGKESKLRGRTLSDETKRKISASMKGRFSGENNPNYGHCHSETRRALISEKARERIIGDEQRMAMSKSHTGKTLSDKTQEKISHLMPTKRRVWNCETQEVFDSLTEAAKQYGFSKSDLSKVCLGKRKRINGMRFQYVQ